MVHMIHDGGRAYVPPPPPPPPAERTQPVQHRVTGSDTVQSLAEQYAVSPEAIRAANPQLGQGGNIARGDVLEIPPPPQSVTGDIDAGSATHSTTDVKVTLKNDDGSITWKPDSLSVKLTDKQKTELDNSRPEGSNRRDTAGFSVSVSEESSVTVTESHSNTHSSFTIATQMQVGVSGEVSAGGGKGGLDVSGGVTTGVEAKYKVSLPGEATVEQAAQVNPFDPTTLPVGGSVTLNGSDYVNTSFDASFRYIGTQTRVNNAEGTSYVMERVDENTVRVTAGPTETINAFNGVGVSVGDVKVMAGREDQLHGATLQTAQFDITTPEGQAALQHFNATGQVPHETAGVSDVATIERIDFSSQTQLRAEFGKHVDLTLGGQANTGSSVKITYPDGSYSLTTDLGYGGNVPLTIEQRFDAEGHELPGERSYTFEVNTDRPAYGWFDRFMGANEASEEEAMATLLNVALTGSVDGSGPVDAGDTVTLTFSESQMQALMEQTQSTVDGVGYGGAHPDLAVMLGSDGYSPTPTDFAISLARNLNNEPYGFIEKLFRIASGSDGDNANQQHDRIDVEVSTS